MANLVTLQLNLEQKYIKVNVSENLLKDNFLEEMFSNIYS